jgi:hypothetical protein
MSKTLQLDELVSGDNLAYKLMHVYSKWRIQRAPWETEQKEIRNYLFATDTSTTTNNSLPWRNSTTLPKLAQIRDNLHAAYLDAVFPNDDWLVWEGDDQESVTKEKRRIIEMYVKNKAKQSGLRETVSKLLYDYIDYGIVLGEVVFVTEKHKDVETDEDVTTYTGPKLERISPWDHYFNPTASTYDKTPKFTRYLKNVGDLKKDLETRPDLKFDKEGFKKVRDIRSTVSTFKLEDWNKADGYFADGFGSLNEYYGSGLVEIIEFEGDIYDEKTDTLHENRIVTIADGRYILRNISNPNWFGKTNKTMVTWRERPDNLYGMSPLANLVGMQYRLDHLENTKADALDQTIMPPKKIFGQVDPFNWGPNENIYIPGGQNEGDVVPMPPNPAAFQVNNEIGFLMEMMEEMAGAPKQAMGIRTPGEKTAFEVQTLENNAGRNFMSKTNKFEIQFLEPVLNLMLEAAKRNISVSDTLKVVDDDFGAATFVQITKEDITAIGKLRPVGSRHFAARAQLIQNMTQLFNSPLGEFIKPDLSRKQLTKMVEETMGLTKYKLFKDNIAVTETAETQRLVQQASMDLQAEAGAQTQQEEI